MSSLLDLGRAPGQMARSADGALSSVRAGRGCVVHPKDSSIALVPTTSYRSSHARFHRTLLARPFSKRAYPSVAPFLSASARAQVVAARLRTLPLLRGNHGNLV